MRTQH